MSATVENITRVVDYARTLQGDEKGEAQVFCDRLFRAFGHAGYKEAGATLEFRIKKESGRGTQFADLIWKPRLLLEMKKGGEKLHLHYRQAFDYWINAVPNRPRHVVLSNFNEFWIYDFDKQLNEPVDTVKVTLMLAKKLALDEAAEILDIAQEQIAFGGADALPLDNLDDNIRCADALFTDWPEVDVVVGNPPYQSKNKMIPELGAP